MKNNRDSSKKHKEIWYRFSLSPEFDKDIKLARKNLEIPPNGFRISGDNVDKSFNKWFKGSVPKEWRWFKEKVDANLTPSKCAELEAMNIIYGVIAKSNDKLFNRNYDFLCTLTELYIVLNSIDIPEVIDKQPFGCEVVDPKTFTGKKSKLENERLSKLFKKSMVIIIYSYTTQDDIKNLLKIRWQYIKQKFKEKVGDNQQRIKSTLGINKNINKDAMSLMEMSRDALGLYRRGDGTKLNAIAKMLSKKYKAKISEDKIRNTVKKYRNPIKG